MPITTFGCGHHKLNVKDDYLLELLSEVEKVTGEEWSLQEMSYEIGWLWNRKTVRSYSLYKSVGFDEWQVINFVPEIAESSINTIVSRSVVGSYLLGIIGQAQYAKNQDS